MEYICTKVRTYVHMYMQDNRTSWQRHSETGTHERGINNPTLVDYPLRLDNTRSCNYIHTDAFKQKEYKDIYIYICMHTHTHNGR